MERIVQSPERVEGVTPVLVGAEIAPDSPGYFVVRASFSGVDRDSSHGIVVKGRPLAERLKAAIEAGVVFTDLHALRDRNGNTFAGYRTNILARQANADLRRLGY